MSSCIRICEKDENGTVSPKYNIKDDWRMIEVRNNPSFYAAERPPSGITVGLKTIGLHTLSDIFLPSGFPSSVSPDYIKYQVFDSLQAFSSSIAGLLSSRAVLEGFGVGDDRASSTNAVLLTVAQDATGRLTTILFAWKYGPALAPEAKMYRLAADIFNDSAFILDFLSPVLPVHLRVAALCLGGALRAVCGVCGGSAKAALSVHFARAGNVGELNAKDTSQETVIGLLGMLCGSYIMPHVVSRSATWIALLLLLSVHLWTNYLAVRAVTLITFNRQRANIAYGLYVTEDRDVPTPCEIARRERIFESAGALRDPVSGIWLGTCTICTSARDFLRAVSKLDSQTSKNFWTVILDILREERAQPRDRLKAWLHAYELGRLIYEKAQGRQSDGMLAGSEGVRLSLDRVNKRFADFTEKADKVGWDLSTDAILTQPVRPIIVDAINGKKGD